MNIDERAESAIQIINELQNQLVELTRTAQNNNDTDTGFERLKRWKERAVRKLSESVNNTEGDKLNSKRKMSFRMGDPIGNLVDEAQMYEGFLIALAHEISEHPQDILNRPTPTKPDQTETLSVPSPKGKAIFIVHGHDELNLYRLKDLLRERYSLDPIVLSSEPGKGRSIIEKFEDEAQRAAFAFVLLTPDDLITKNDAEYSQARPNVIFELGWFYGRLGRERVCILYKKGTKIHSDLDGVSRIEFTGSVIDKISEIENELIAVNLLSR
nr:nucleotide-binding protein [Pseudomonas sp.]